MGDKVRVKVAAANLEKRQLDYHWVPAGETSETPTASKDKKTKPVKRKSK
jgi:ribonuclease R